MKQIIQKTLGVLNIQERKQLTRLTLLNLLMSIADIAALALLLAVIHLYTQPESATGNSLMPYWLLKEYFLAPIIIFLLLFILKNVASFFVTKAQYTFVFDVATRLAQSGMIQYLNTPYPEYVAVDAAVRVRQISHQPIEFSNHILSGLMQIFTEAVLTTIAVIAIILFNAKLFLLLLLILLPPVIIAAYLSKKRLKAVRTNVRNTAEKATQYLQEALEGYIESNVYGKKDFFAGRFVNYQKQLNKHLTALQITQIIPSRFIEVFAILGLFLLIVVNKYSNNSTASELINIGAFMAAAYKIIPGITKMANLASQIKMYAFCIDDVAKNAESDDGTNNVIRESIKTVSFKDVSFTHGANQVLHHFNMDINQHHFVGIASASGRGKTTMINLLLGFLNEDRGSIEINGVTTNGKLREKYWHDVAYVKQQNFLIHDSVKNNITLSDDKFDESLFQKAIQATGLVDFINSFPEKEDKIISDKGKNISGGQRQRIAIARALYKNAGFIILDEPFSELDETSEHTLLQHFKTLAQQGCIVILITHHTASLSYCNKIVSIHD